MTILDEDLHIRKSAVMADVPEGGGAMAGEDVPDGESNAMFPDVSSDNRAGGALHLRKVFGVALTDNTDLALGTGWCVMRPPMDPNVIVSVFQTPGWFDERTDAISLVERMLTKGPRLLCRIQDTHYAGTKVLQLYNPQPATSFPAAGDAIFVRNPDGQEQRLRALKVTYSTASVITDSGSYEINLATCELNRALAFDLLGRPIQRTTPNSSTTATVFSTVPAEGARFGGVKRLASPIVLGESLVRTLEVEDGIFTQLVPATTNPTPVADVYPLLQRPTLSRTSRGTVSFSSAATVLTAGTVLQLPTAVEPGSLTMTHGATAFTTAANGNLLQGSTVVGTVDWAGRAINMASTAPNYGTATNSISYLPATVTGATAHSIAVDITEANQSTALVNTLQPPPAPGTLSISYMAQDRWYELVEDGTGKIAGADSSYGSGTLSFVTGSFTATLGAPPDIGSTLVISWGDNNSARSAVGTVPSRAWLWFALADAPQPGTLAFAWSRGATNYTATVAAGGAVTGPAQVSEVLRGEDGVYRVGFSPDTLPDTLVNLTYQRQVESDAFDRTGSTITLTDAPARAGSVRFRAIATAAGQPSRVVNVIAGADGIVRAEGQAIGTINHSTGVISLSAPSFVKSRWGTRRVSVPGSFVSVSMTP